MHPPRSEKFNDACSGGTDPAKIKTGPRTHTHALTKQTRPLEWRRRQLQALLRMVNENEEAMLDALKTDLRRGRFAGLALEIWDTVGQVCIYMCAKSKYAFFNVFLLSALYP